MREREGGNEREREGGRGKREKEEERGGRGEFEHYFIEVYTLF